MTTISSNTDSQPSY